MSRRCPERWDGARCRRVAGHAGEHRATAGTTELTWPQAVRFAEALYAVYAPRGDR